MKEWIIFLKFFIEWKKWNKETTLFYELKTALN